MRTILVLAVVCCLKQACIGQDTIVSGLDERATANPHEMLNATLWQQSSAEYFGVTTQIYQLAKMRLDEAIKDKSSTASPEQVGTKFANLPPAIILDIDETVLNNTGYEARIIRELGQYTPDSFEEWVNEGNGFKVPGVVEFLEYANSKGVAVFYFSGRETSLHKGTLKSLESVGVPIKDPGRNLVLNDGTSTSERRARIAKSYRILLLLGDNLDDFTPGSKQSAENRRLLAEEMKERWGKNWIILPNAIYGHSEATHYDFQYELPRSEMLMKKTSALKLYQKTSNQESVTQPVR